MDKKIEIMLYNATTDYKINNNIEVVKLDLEYSRPGATNRGKITINLENALKVWTIADFKQFNDIVMMSINPADSAIYVNNYIVACINALKAEKEKYTHNLDIPFKNKIETFINRLYKFNQVLKESYGIDSAEIDETPKYKKAVVYTMILNEGKKTIEVFNGFSFNYRGYTLHVYDNKKRKTKYIIVPSCGMALTSFNGSIKSAHNYIEKVLPALKDPEKQKMLSNIENEFSALMAENGFSVDYDSIVIQEPETIPGPTTEKEAEKKKEKAADNKQITPQKAEKTAKNNNINYVLRFNIIYNKIIANNPGLKADINNGLNRSKVAILSNNHSYISIINNSLLPICNSSVYSHKNISTNNKNKGSPINYN